MVVTYKYTRVTDDADKDICTVNAVYMDDTGKIIETKTITGKLGEEYSLPENEYEEMHLVRVPENARGAFVKGEINVVFNYSTMPDPFKDMMVYVFIGTGIILAMCGVSVIYSRIRSKRRFCADMDIDE